MLIPWRVTPPPPEILRPTKSFCCFGKRHSFNIICTAEARGRNFLEEAFAEALAELEVCDKPFQKE